MPTPGEKLRALIDKGEHFVCGDTYSAITGRIVEYVGFPAAYLGGHACSAFHYAVPDNGVLQPGRADRAGQPHRQRDDNPADRRRRYAGRDGGRRLSLHPPLHPAGHRRLPCRGRAQSQAFQARQRTVVDRRPAGADRRGARGRSATWGQDFVIIARCDELYTSEAGGGGTGSMEEAIKRGHAYLRPAPTCCSTRRAPIGCRELVKAFGSKIPIATMGFTVPGTRFNMATGGWVTAAANHLKMMRELMETGSMPSRQLQLSREVRADRPSALRRADRGMGKQDRPPEPSEPRALSDAAIGWSSMTSHGTARHKRGSAMTRGLYLAKSRLRRRPN